MQAIFRAGDALLRCLERLFASNPANLGKLLALVGSVFSFASIATNKISNPANLSSFLVVRAMINSAICHRLLVDTGGSYASPRRYIGLVLIRSAIGCVAAFLYTAGIAYLELNHFYSVVNTQPVFTFWMALLFMGEAYSNDRFLCSLLAVLGVVFIVNPNYISLDFSDPRERYENFYMGIIIALSAAFLKAIILVLVKKLSGASPYKTMVFFEGSRAALPALVLVFTNDVVRFHSWTSLGYTYLSGFFELGYQLLCLLSMRYERASVIGIIETLSIVFSFFFDALVFGKELQGGSILGTILIVGSALYLTTKKADK